MRQIPFGLKFYQPETRFNSRQGSFNNIVDQVVAMRKANPALCAKHGWSTDWNATADDVDAFNSAICERMGWTDFISQPASATPPIPKLKALSPASEKQLSAAAGKARKIWQGVKTLNEWIESGVPAVPSEQSQKRAETCVACSLNGSGGLEEWFTKPASMAIKAQFEKLESRKLSTSVDDKLGVCQACSCPLKLKVHTPIQFITTHLGEDTRRALDPGCWITQEMSTAVDTV